MGRRGAVLIAVAIFLGFAAHGVMQFLAAREGAKQRLAEPRARGDDREETGARAEHWQRQDAFQERALTNAEAQRQWERGYWNNVFDEIRFLARNRPATGRYQLIRTDGKDVFLLNTATGEVLKKTLE
jgi:hypothetical protein